MGLLLMLLLAGCGSNAAKVRNVPSAEIPDEYGSIHGTVVDEELIGVPGVRVEILELKMWTITDVNGTFRFDYVAPGSYKLEARLRDFEPFQQAIDVTVGQEAQAILHVSYPPVTRPYHVTRTERGFFGCRVADTACPVYSNPNDRNVFEIPAGPNLTALLIEVTWQTTAGNPNVNWFMARVFHKNEANPRALYEHGPPSMRLVVTSSILHGVEGDLRLVMSTQRVDYTRILPYLPGVAYEQPFNVYITSFFLKDNTKDFSALPS